MRGLSDDWHQTILEANNGDAWAERLVRETFKIPANQSVGEFFDEIVVAEFGQSPGRDDFRF